MTDEAIDCDDCGSSFTIQHEKEYELQYCPFCGGDLMHIIDDEEDFWIDDEDC